MKIIDNIILQESFIDYLKPIWQIFMEIFYGIKSLASNISENLNLKEIGLTILAFARKIPLMGNLIPEATNEEQKVKETLGIITTGDIVVKIMNLLQTISLYIWKFIPLTNKYKQERLIPFISYNDRQSFIRALYKIMIDAEIPTKYANAYLVAVTMKIPIYNMIYVFKSVFDRSKSNPTEEDQLYAFTSGNPVINKQGLNETETILQSKIQKFIQLKLTTSGEIETNRKLAYAIVKETVVATAGLLFAKNFKVIFQFGFFGIMDDNTILYKLFGWILVSAIIAYYFYFLITGLILTSLAIEEEEAFSPSEDYEEKNRQIEAEGGLKLN